MRTLDVTFTLTEEHIELMLETYNGMNKEPLTVDDVFNNPEARAKLIDGCKQVVDAIPEVMNINFGSDFFNDTDADDIID